MPPHPRGGPGWAERELSTQDTEVPTEDSCTPATKQEAGMLPCPRLLSLTMTATTPVMRTRLCAQHWSTQGEDIN